MLACLKQKFLRTGHLSQQQFGFREENHICSTKKLVREAASFSNAQRRLCGMVVYYNISPVSKKYYIESRKHLQIMGNE